MRLCIPVQDIEEQKKEENIAGYVETLANSATISNASTVLGFDILKRIALSITFTSLQVDSRKYPFSHQLSRIT